MRASPAPFAVEQIGRRPQLKAVRATITSARGERLADVVHVADAYLWAAAPELLEALKGAIGALEFSQDYHRDLGNEEQAFCADRLDAARAAIAKATGGDQ